MEPLFLTRDVNEALQRKCIATLDRWSASIPFSPIKKIGSATDPVSAIELAAYHTTVTTQIEKRWFLDHEVPYRGQPIPSNPRSKSDYDVWKLDFRRYADFASHTESIDLPDTRQKLVCPRCKGLGRVDCETCYARGWLTCRRCNRDGKPGWLKHSACEGQGQIRKTRKVAHTKRCGCWDRKKCTRCKGSGTIVVEEKQSYYEPCTGCRNSGYVRCDGCPEREGEVRCSTCGGERQVTCPRCQGEKQVMTYVTAEKSEEPKKNASQQIPKDLPRFTKQKDPLSDLQGPVVFTQDERERIATFGFREEPAAAVLSAEVEHCRSGHAGHILRQRIEVARCSLVEYRYRYSGVQYPIYLNPAHNLVEDIAGPIQALISNTDGIAAKAHGAKKYEDAYRLIVRALCMDEATRVEKTLRDNILAKLLISYGLWAVVAWLPACLVWWAITANIWKTSSVPGVLASLVPLALGVYLFARDIGLSFRGRRARILAATLTGVGAFLSAAAIHEDSAQWQAHWTDYLPFGIVTLALIAAVILRFKERARRTRIEKYADEFSNVQALEAYVVGLDPSPTRERSLLTRLVGSTFILLLAAGLVTYFGLSRSLTGINAIVAEPSSHPQPEARQALRTLTGHSLDVLDVALTPDGRTVVSGSSDTSIRIWDVASGAILHTLQGHSEGVGAVAVSPDARILISGSYDGTVRAWNITTGEAIWTAVLDRYGVYSLAIASDGSNALVGGYESLSVLDLGSGRLLSKLNGHTHTVFDVAINKGMTRAASASSDYTIRTWNLGSAQPLLALSDPYFHGGCHAVVFTPDDRTILTACHTLNAWDVDTGKPLRTILDKEANDLKITPDGNELIVARFGGLELLDLNNGEILCEFQGHSPEKHVNAVAISQDGSFAVSASSDTTLKVWNLR